MKFGSLSGFGLLILVMVCVPGAYADLIIPLNIGDTAISTCCGTGPFGTVDFHQASSSSVSATVTLNSPYLFVDTGQAGAFAFNIANILFSNLMFVVSPTSVAAGFSGTVAGNGTGGEHMDGFGSFGYAIQGDAMHTSGASTPIGQLLTFIVSTKDASSLPLSDFNVNSTGGTASPVAADIFCPPSPSCGTSGVTGFVGNSGGGTGQSVVPEPGSMLLAGTGLLAAFFLKRRLRAK